MNQLIDIVNFILIKKIKPSIHNFQDFHHYLYKYYDLLSDYEYLELYREWNKNDLYKDINFNYQIYKTSFLIAEIYNLNTKLFNKNKECIPYVQYYKYYINIFNKYDTCSILLDDCLNYYIDYESMYIPSKINKQIYDYKYLFIFILVTFYSLMMFLI
jgi:hypothetical protein